MPTFDFNIDRVHLEIFPNHIWQDPNVVFHGTSEYHSPEIERNGFIPATSPFDINDAKELIRVLQLPEIINFDRTQAFGMTVSRTLNSYVFGIENNDFRLSFAYLSYLCVFFSTGQSKGGQTFGNIREAKSIIQQAIQANQAVEGLITEPIIRLFELENNVANANGVVYALKLEAPYNGITEEYGNIHSTLPVIANNIIGKVILPNDIDINEFTIQTVKQRNKQKLLKPGHLGIILNRMTLNDDDEI
jgi:hypothetical protein